MDRPGSYRAGSIGVVAVLAGVLAILPAGAAGQSMSADTEAQVRRSTVQVLMGDKRPGSDRIGHKIGAFGSGCFINSTGLVVTNNHVVDPTHRMGNPVAALEARSQFSLLQYRVTVNGGTAEATRYKADLLYQSESADLALLQVRSSTGDPLATPHYLTIAQSNATTVGQKTWLFGFPGGNLMSTAPNTSARVNKTEGNIIAIPRRPNGRIPAIVTDVQAAGGNSGGPMVNQKGAIIGIVSTIGADMRSSSKVNSRLIPGDVVVNLVRVAKYLNKLTSEVDLEPFAEWRPLSAAHAEPQALAERLHITDPGLVGVTERIESGDRDGLVALIDKTVDRKAPDNLKEQARALEAVHFLRTGDYERALSLFKRLSRADVVEVREYALGHVYLLKEHGDGLYDGEPLSDATVWDRAGKVVGAAIVQDAREQISAHRQALPDDYGGWKKLTKGLAQLEDDLLAADSLDPGCAELDVFLTWRFRQDANWHELRRLFGTTKDLERKIDDFNALPRPKNRRDASRLLKKKESIENKLARFMKQLTEVSRAWEDMHEIMGNQGWAGFRIDDPAAVGLLQQD